MSLPFDKHTKWRRHTCDLCPTTSRRSFPNAIDLLRHKRILHHAYNAVASGTCVWKCDIDRCSGSVKVYRRLENLKKHVQSMHGENHVSRAETMYVFYDPDKHAVVNGLPLKQSQPGAQPHAESNQPAINAESFPLQITRESPLSGNRHHGSISGAHLNSQNQQAQSPIPQLCDITSTKTIYTENGCENIALLHSESDRHKFASSSHVYKMTNVNDNATAVLGNVYNTNHFYNVNEVPATFAASTDLREAFFRQIMSTATILGIQLPNVPFVKDIDEVSKWIRETFEAQMCATTIWDGQSAIVPPSIGTSLEHLDQADLSGDDLPPTDTPDAPDQKTQS